MGFIGNIRYKIKKYNRNKYKKYPSHYEEKYLTVNGDVKNITVKHIRSVRDKFDSLMRTSSINLQNAYIFKNAKVFNSFGIFYKVDVIFCNKNFEVITLISDFTSQKISHYYPNSYFIFCLASGMIKFLDIKKNDIVRYT